MGQKFEFIFLGLVILFAFGILLLSMVSEWIITEALAQNTTYQNATTQQMKSIKMVVNWTDHTVKIVNLTNNETISIRNFTFSPDSQENSTGNISSSSAK